MASIEDLRCFTVHFFYEVKDAEIYGGKGTTGYAEMKYDMAVNADTFSTPDKYLENSRINAQILSTQLEVPVENITSICRDKYLKETGTDNEYDGSVIDGFEDEQDVDM